MTISRNSLRLTTLAPLLAWMAVIFFMSSRPGGGTPESGLVAALIRWISPSWAASMGHAQLELLDGVVRKVGHVVEYFVLALLAARWLAAGRATLNRREWLLAWGLCILYAISDELHQALVPLRGPSAWDVLLDAVASGVAILMLRRRATRRRVTD